MYFFTGNLITQQIAGIPVSNFARTTEDIRIYSPVEIEAQTTVLHKHLDVKGHINNFKLEHVIILSICRS